MKTQETLAMRSVVRSLKLSRLILTLILAFGSARGSADVSSLGSWVQNIASRIPGDIGIALGVYMDTMRPQQYKEGELGRANVGIRTHLLEQWQNSACFQKIGKTFYDNKLFTSDKKAPPARIYQTLNDASVNGNQYSPGWLWNMALESAGGQPNLAIKLIAFCGHDDIDQAPIFEGNQVLNCPFSGSAMFFPEALGKGIDTSPAIKKYVIEAQKIHIDPKLIKAKMYHVYGAAYNACRVIEKGVAPKDAADIAQKFAFAYRRLRTCESSRMITETLKPYYLEFQKRLAKYNRGQSNGDAPTFEELIEQAVREDKLTKAEDAFGPWFYGYNINSNKDHSKFLKRVADYYYASKIYFTMTNCPTGQISQFGELMQAHSSKLTSIMKDSLFLPPNFDEQCEGLVGGNCSGAKMVLQTWDADFKWTMEQHRLGAEFAASHCKPLAELEKYPTPPICK